MFRGFRKWRARSRFARAWRAGDWHAAIEAGELLLAETPNDPELLNDFGVVLLEAGHAGRAEVCLRRVNEIRETAIITNNMGRALLVCGRHAEAGVAFRRAIELDPSDPQARYNLTVCLREEGRAKEAAEELRRFATAFPRHAAARNDLGCLADEGGDREEALACYAVSLELAPEYLPARLNLIRGLCELGRYSEATPHLEALAAGGMRVRVSATDVAVEIDLNGQPFYRGPVKKE